LTHLMTMTTNKHRTCIRFCVDSDSDNDAKSENPEDSAAMRFGMSKGTVVLGTQLAPYKRISAPSCREAAASDVEPSRVAGIPPLPQTLDPPGNA
jgi:hypothetical protein